jgi:hypothetical protein
MAEWTSGQAVAAASLLALVTIVTFVSQRIFYRLRLHPLANFPGPKAAAITTLWKAYVECVLNKSFCEVLQELHTKYGNHGYLQTPVRYSHIVLGEIIRVGPDEVK